MKGKKLEELLLRLDGANLDATDTDLALINKHTQRAVTRDEVFIFEGICSTDAMDSYFTRMDPKTTLQNFKNDLDAGVSLLNGHNVETSPFGRSFSATIEGEANGATAVRGRFYIPRDVEINGVNTNQTIRAIETGVTRDLSVGFGGDYDYICSADNLSLSETPYWPGDTDENGERVFFWIVNANLREVSTVYKGACPGALIDKMRSEGENLDSVAKEKLQDRYNVRVFGDSPKKGSKKVDIKTIMAAIADRKVDANDLVKELRGFEGVTITEAPEDKAILEAARAIKVEGVDEINAESISRVAALAVDGLAYRKDLINQAVEVRTGVQADKFDADNYRKVLEGMPGLDFVRSEIASYESQKKEMFTPGRSTQSGFNPGDEGDEVIINSRGYKERNGGK